MTPAIELLGVRKSFGVTSIIRDVSLTIEHGTRQALIGPNGAGKSTLFNLITGKYPVSAGRIRLKGEDVTGRRPYEINRRGLSRSFQVTNIFPWLSVFENVRCAVLWSLGYRYSFWNRIDAAADAVFEEAASAPSDPLAALAVAVQGDASAGGAAQPTPDTVRDDSYWMANFADAGVVSILLGARKEDAAGAFDNPASVI